MNAKSTATVSRREAIRSAVTVLGAAGLARAAPPHHRAEAHPDPASTLKCVPCLFTKPLGNRPFRELPDFLPSLGVDAVDLTCRPKGHVLPERVADDLPAACERLNAAGIDVPMITTAITDADQDHAEAIVRTAGGLGIRYAKLGYYPYGDLRKLHATLGDVKARLREVAALCRQYGVQAGFHNHSGTTVGAPMWDVWHLIRDLPDDAIGSYFDVRHATVEGGQSGWRIGLSLLAPRIIMVAVKDFLWYKDDKRGWRVRNVPLGEGMVRCEEAFRQLKGIPFAGPISLHMEYGEHTPPVGSDADGANLDAIRRDWTNLLATLRQVGLF